MMETDEHGVLAFEEMEEMWDNARTPWGFIGAVAQAQHEADAAVVEKCRKTPGGIVFPDYVQGWNAAIDCVLLALRGGLKGK